MLRLRTGDRGLSASDVHAILTHLIHFDILFGETVPIIDPTEHGTVGVEEDTMLVGVHEGLNCAAERPVVEFGGHELVGTHKWLARLLPSWQEPATPRAF